MSAMSTPEDENDCYLTQAMEFLYENQLAVSTACASVAGLSLLRYWLSGGWCHSKATLQGKTVIITGANSGIGKETARDLARRGARVIMACRNVDAAVLAATEIQNESNKGTLCVKELDLASFESIRRFASDIMKTEERLDILINNAGLWCSKQKTKDGYDTTFGTNHLGPFLLTNLLLNLLKKSAPSRIVNVASDAHLTGNIKWDDLNLDERNSYGPWKAYSQSKLANILFTVELADRLEDTGVTTYALHPGMVYTGFLRHQPSFIALPVAALMRLFAKNSVQGAQTTIYCAVDEKLEKVSGKYYKDCSERIPARKATDKKSATRLWTESMKMVGLTENVQE